LGVWTLAGAALIFFILPRLSSSGYLRSLGIQDSLVTGFSHDVSLGGIGQIQQSSNVVMHIQVLDGKIPEDVKWRGIALANFDGRRWYNAPELPTVTGLSNAGIDLTHISNFSFYSAAQSAPPLPTMSYRVVMEPVGLNMFFLAPVPLRIRGEYPVLDLMSDGSIFNRRAPEGGNDNDNPPMVGAYAA